jgi:hypothetical protein
MRSGSETPEEDDTLSVDPLGTMPAAVSKSTSLRPNPPGPLPFKGKGVVQPTLLQANGDAC